MSHSSSWRGYLTALKSRLFRSRRHKRERGPLSPFPTARLLIERLEDRTLLATASLSSGLLDIACSSGDTVTLNLNGSNYSIAGATGTTTPAASAVTSISVHGGGDVN